MSQTQLQQIASRDCPDLAALLSLLADHPTVDNDPVLQGAVNVIQRRYSALWESLEQISEAS